MTIEFDDDVEIPKRKGRPKQSEIGAAIPFDEFPVGKSHFVPGIHPSTVAGAVAAYEKRFPAQKFSYRFFMQDPKKGVTGVRIWRMR